MAWKTRTNTDPLAGGPPPAAQRPQPPPDNYFLASQPDPGMHLQAMFRGMAGKDMPWRMWLGMDGERWRFTEPERHLLAIAPPRSYAGKTSSVMTPIVTCHQGPVVTASTKDDVLEPTAMARAQLGQVWCYDPSGDTDIPPGVRQLRWSPISNADDWDVAIRTAQSMVATINTDNVTHGEHWKESAADLLAPVFHWAARSGGTMRDARDVVYAHATRLREVWEWLARNNAGDAAAMLLSILDAGPDEKRSIASSAARALRGYRLPGAIESTENENFDVVDFVNGGPLGLRADTIYITGSTEEQNQLVAPLVVGLLSQIQRATYRRHRALTNAGLLGGPGSGPILYALDELYGLAPMPSLPHILTEGGSQGLLVAAAVQDLALIKSRWPAEAGSFLTLFGHALIFPGIRDDETLKKISTLLGQEDVTKRSETLKNQPDPGHTPGLDWLAGGKFTPATYSEQLEHATYSEERRPRYEPNQVGQGPSGLISNEVFHFGPDLWHTITTTPYYRTAPWPHVLTSYLERAISGRVPEWRYWEAYASRERPAPTSLNDLPDLSHEQPGIEDVLPGLPVPRLHDWAKRGREFPPETVDGHWSRHYLHALEERAHILERGPRQARWEIPGGSAGLPCVTHPGARLPKAAVPKTTARAPEFRSTPVSEEPGAGEEAPPRASNPPAMADAATTNGASAEQERDPGPVTIFPFDGDWRLEDDAAMGARAPGEPWPAAWTERMQHLNAAIDAEKEQRRQRGDGAAVEQFELGNVRWAAEWERNPDFRAQCAEETLEDVLQRRIDHGFWRWLPPVQRRGYQSFLRGEPVDAAYAAGPPAPKPVPHSFPFEASWGPDEEAAMYARSDTSPWPDVFVATWNAMELAIVAEKKRRRAEGDTASIAQFDEARQCVDAEWARNATWREACQAERLAKQVRGEDDGWWKWVTLPLTRLLTAFLRGEQVDPASAACPPAPGTVAPAPPSPPQAETDPIHTVTTEQPEPPASPHITHFPFEDAWGPGEEAAMRSRTSDDLYHATYPEVWRAMEDAIHAEARRRCEHRDSISIARFEYARALAVAEWDRNPDLRAESKEQALEARLRGEDWGWWAWVPAPEGRLITAFLRGEELDPPATPPEPGSPPVTHFPFEERWRPEDDTAMWTHRQGEPYPEAHYEMLHATDNAVAAEKTRRREHGDAASVERFEQAFNRLVDELEGDPELVQRWREEAWAATARGEDRGWWGWMSTPQVLQIQAFLRGEDVDHGEAPAPDAAAEGATDTTAGLHQPDTGPVRDRFPFEAEWGRAQDDAMWSRTRPPIQIGANHPAVYYATKDAMEAAIAAESNRRREQGDAASVDRFLRALESIGEQWWRNPAFQTRAEHEVAEALARGEDLGWWKWLAPAMSRLIQAYLRGEDAGGPYAEGPTPATAAAEDPQATAEPPDDHIQPVTALPPAAGWEPDWGAGDDAAMAHWDQHSGDRPECWVTTMAGLNTAVEHEKQRRRELGDTASIDRFEREGRQILANSQLPGAKQAADREPAEARARGEYLGFWAWFPPGTAAHNRAFLRGEGAHVSREA